MRGEVLFEKMTGISDEFIAEAALVAPVGVAAPRKNPFASLSRALNSGWGVACICFIVAIASVVGMVAWGRMGEMTGPGSDPAVRFAFSYEMTDNDGSAWSGTAMPGDIVNVSTTIVNHGKPFKAYDFFAFAQLVLQEDESVVIAGHYPVVDTDKHTVESGSTGSRTFHFHIPENATPGVYDLVLSYDGEKQVFGGALTVGEATETYPPVDPDAPRYVFTVKSLHSFSYGEPVDRPAEQGEQIYLSLSILNNGPAFQIRDSEWARLSAVCVLQSDDSVTLEWRYDPRDGGNQPYWVQTGDTETLGFVLTIPENATPGVYDLVLSYDGEKQVFGGALTVGETAETYPPAEADHAFSFGFKTPNMQSKLPKDFPIDVHVTNEGEPFTYEGDPDDFSPDSAILYHMESGYEIKGYGTESGRPPKPCNVYFGQKGVKNYTFPIPADAPEGVYGIKLTYRRASESLPNVLIVNDGKVGTYVDRFTFGYEKPDDAYPGDTVSFFTQVANEWDAFTYEGYSSDFAPAATLIHRQTQYRLDGTFDTATDFGTHTVEHWALGNATQVFMIPADAPVGDYDLVLSYGGYSQTFERALTLLDPIYKDLDYPPVSDDHFFTFGIEAVDGFAIPGDRIDVTAWVVNQGEPFSFMGDPYTYAPTIILYHMDSDYVIQGLEAPTGVEPRPCNVLTGQKGSGTYTFFIPADAPTGEYGIKLSYHGLESSFDSRLTVAVP